MLKDKQFRELVIFNVFSNLKAEVNGFALRYLWWIIEPSLHFAILYLVFGIFFKGNQNNNFIPFLFCGIIPWFWFSKSITNGMDAVLKGGSIIRDKYIPKYFFAIVSVASDAFKELPVLVILLIVLLLTGVFPNNTWLFLPLILLLQLLLITSIVTLTSILVPYFLDLKPIIGASIQILMFGAGTFYDYKTIPEKFHVFYEWNPIAILINMYRNILMYQKPIAITNYLYVLSFTCVIGIISYFAHKKLDKDIPKVLFR
jgi:lipopolysaccharide transport system permease protein